MQNVIDVPLMFLYCKVLYKYHYNKLKYRRATDGATTSVDLTPELLAEQLGDFDARRLIDDLPNRRWKQSATFDAMYEDLCDLHEQGRNRIGRDKAIQRAMQVECAELTPEVQEASFDALTSVYSELDFEFDYRWQLARRECFYGPVTWDTLKPHHDAIWENTCMQLNEHFRGYFCDIFWGEEAPRV